MIEVRKRKVILYSVAAAVAVLAAVLLWPVVSNVLIPVFLAMLLSFLLRPLIECLKKYMPVRMAILGVFLLIIIIAVFIITSIIPELQSQIGQLEDTIPQIQKDFNSLLERVQQYIDKTGLQVDLVNIIKNLSGDPNQIAGDVMKWIVSNVSKLSYIAIIPALTYYLLKDGDKFYGFIKSMISEEHRNKYLRVYHILHRQIWQFIVGQAVLSLIVAVATWLALMLCGVRFSMILAVFMGLMEFIPYFGPFIGAVPIVIVSLIDGWQKLVFALLGVLIVQQLEGSFLSPLIIGKHTGLHPAWVIITILAGGEILGIIGMIVSVPLVIVLKTIISSVYQDFIRNRTMVAEPAEN